MTIQEHLVYPPVVSLIKIAVLLARRMQKENINVHNEEEFREKLKKIVRKYSEKAWKDEKLPLYLFDSNWNSPQLEHDLDFILEGEFITLSEVTINQIAIDFLENYERMDIFSDYLIKNVEKIIDTIIKEMKEETNPDSSKILH